MALAIASTGAAIHFRRSALAHAVEVERTREAAMTDLLTGVLNRRGFIEAAERELNRAQRYGHPLAFAFVDVRGLKAVNDTRGHGAGDRLLRDVATLLTETSRSHDIVGRIGGDELAILLAEQSIEGVAAVGRRLKAKIPRRRTQLGLGEDWDLTVGIAIYPSDGTSIPELLATADRRLYLQRGIRLRQPVTLAAGQRALQPVNHRDGGGIHAAENGEIERDKVAQHHQ